MRITNVSVTHECLTNFGMAVDTGKKPRGRPPKRVPENTAGGRLQRLRLDNGLGQKELADLLRIDRTMISKYEDGTHPLSPDQLLRLAERFSVTPSNILFGSDVEVARRRAPIVGQVGAGAEVEAIQDANPELVEVPGDFADGQAFRVTGESCLPVFEDGDILVVKGSASAAEGEFLNRYCVVETSENLGFVKKVVRGPSVLGQGQLYTLQSPNAPPIENVQLKRVRPISIRILRGGRG